MNGYATCIDSRNACWGKDTIRFGLPDFNRRRNVVFPVPALPVRKRCVPVFSINCHANANSGFCSIISSMLVGGVKVTQIKELKPPLAHLFAKKGKSYKSDKLRATSAFRDIAQPLLTCSS